MLLLLDTVVRQAHCGQVCVISSILSAGVHLRLLSLIACLLCLYTPSRTGEWDQQGSVCGPQKKQT